MSGDGVKPTSAQRDLAKPWQWPRGRSANPGGKPGLPALRRDIRDFAGRQTPEIIRKLTQHVHDNLPTRDPQLAQSCIHASKLVLAYAHGEAARQVQVTGPDGGPLQVMSLTVAVLEQDLEARARRLGVALPEFLAVPARVEE